MSSVANALAKRSEIYPFECKPPSCQTKRVSEKPVPAWIADRTHRDELPKEDACRMCVCVCVCVADVANSIVNLKEM